MRIDILQAGPLRAAYIHADEVLVSEPDDALELLGIAYENEVHRLILDRSAFSADFFELRTGLAGEVLQKFSTYSLFLAIVGDFSGVESKSLRDFIRESNRTGRILFVDSAEAALTAWKA